MSFVTIYNVCHYNKQLTDCGHHWNDKTSNSGFKNRDPSSVICLKMAKSIILSTNSLFKCSLKYTPLCEAVWLLLKTSTCMCMLNNNLNAEFNIFNYIFSTYFPNFARISGFNFFFFFLGGGGQCPPPPPTPRLSLCNLPFINIIDFTVVCSCHWLDFEIEPWCWINFGTMTSENTQIVI